MLMASVHTGRWFLQPGGFLATWKRAYHVDSYEVHTKHETTQTLLTTNGVCGTLAVIRRRLTLQGVSFSGTIRNKTVIFGNTISGRGNNGAPDRTNSAARVQCALCGHSKILSLGWHRETSQLFCRRCWPSIIPVFMSVALVVRLNVRGLEAKPHGGIFCRYAWLAD